MLNLSQYQFYFHPISVQLNIQPNHNFQPTTIIKPVSGTIWIEKLKTTNYQISTTEPVKIIS